MKPLRTIQFVVGISVAVVCRAEPLPTGGVVTAGSASFTATTNSLVVNQGSNRAIINWNSFSVGTGNSVQFIQPSSSSATLNRVVSADPSQILGQVTANGQVFLVNPNGIVVGPSGRIEAAGIFLSTGNVADADFLGGTPLLDVASPGMPVVVTGQLHADGPIDIRASAVEFSNGAIAGEQININAIPGAPLPPVPPGVSVTPPITVTGTINPTGYFVIGSGHLQAGRPVLAGGNTVITVMRVEGHIQFGGSTSAVPGYGGSAIGLASTPVLPQEVSSTTKASAGPAPQPSVSNALIPSSPAIGSMNHSPLVDGVVMVRMSLVDASPIALR